MPFSIAPTQQEIAQIEKAFTEKSTKEMPISATVTKDGILLLLPTFALLDTDGFDNLSQEEQIDKFVDFEKQWSKIVTNVFNELKKDEKLKRNFQSDSRRSYERSRFHSASNAYSETEQTRNYSSFRDSYLSERGISKESGSFLSEEEGRRIKESAERILNSSKNNSTARFGVVIDPNLKSNYKDWQRQHPDGIVAYRVNYNSYNTPAEVKDGHIGNPFSEDNRGSQTVEQFYNWLVKGNNYGNPKATEEFRQAIISKILNTPNNSPVLYYKELGRPSHATVIGYLINNKQLLQQQVSKEMETSPGTTTTPAMEKTLNSLRNYYRWKKNHVEFKTDTHEYLLDGVPVDYSVTQYGEKVFGKPNIQGDYSHSTAMGNDVDELTRDFFAGKDVEGNTYKNLNEARKQQVISDLKRFQKYLDGKFKSGYRVITTPLELVAKMTDNGKEVTVAGTPDMLVVDSKGDVYMVDMKVKNHPITQTYNGKEVDDRRNYTFQQNGYRQIIETVFPELRGRVKELNLLWFDTSYPRQGREAKFETSKTGVVTVTDPEEGQVLLSEYSKWTTPSLKENVEESVIPLENNKDVLPGVQPLDSYSDTVETPQSSSPSGAAINPEIAEFYSGAADGADTVWANRARKLGIKVTEYTEDSWDTLPDDWKEKLGLEYLKVAEDLGRKPLALGEKGYKLVRRDMMQADKADAIFAIGTVVKPGEKGKKGFVNKADHEVVDGGTAYAVQRGIQRGIPVYLFDQKDVQWKMWDANTNTFIGIEEPVLTPNAATIGTRGIDNNGVQAIESILNKSLGIAPTTTQKPHLKSDAYDSALQTQSNRIVDFYNTFSPQQIKDRGTYIANLFSDIIDTHYFEKLDALDDIINDPNRSETEKNAARAEKVKVLDPVNGRQYIAGEVVGIPQIIEEIKETLRNWMEDDIENNNGEREVLFQNTLEYFEDLFNTQASLDIEESEGIRIIGYTTKNQTAEDEDAEERENGDDETGHVVSGSDGWNFQVRFENPFESMSKKVRGMFYDIERPETEKDDLGMTRHYSVGQIYASILSYFAKNVQSADDYMKIVKDINEIPEGSIAASIVEGMTQEEVDEMYPDGFPVFYVFEKMQSVYPWADQVIVRLTNDFMSPDYNVSAKYPSTRGAMASQLYTNFKKAFIPYGKIKLNEDGIIPLNHQMEDQMQYDKLVANYNNRILLTDRSVYDAQGRIVKENANYVADIIDKLKEEFEEEAYWDPVMLAEVLENNPEQYNEFLEKARYVLQSFGISATTDNVASYMGMSKDEEHPENMDNHVLINIFNDLLDIVEALNKVENDRVATYNYILDTMDSHNRHLWGHFFDGRGMITDASYLQSFYDSSSKKTKYSYSADNYLMQRFRGLAMGNMEDRRKYIDEHYGKYDWFRNQKTGEWRNKWLDFWYNLPDDNINELPYQNIDVVVEPKTNGKDKVRKYVDWEKSDIYQVMTRSYAVDDWKKRDFTAMYLAPIFSDSPMSMTVRGPILNDAQLFGGEDEAGNWKSL